MPQRLDIDVVKVRFTSARGVAGDARWAERAVRALEFGEEGGVARERALHAVADLAAIVAESGEGPETLFGEPASWAAEQQAQWRLDGVDVGVDPPSSHRFYGFLENVLGMATLIGLASTAAALIGGRLNGPQPVLMFLLPVLAALLGGFWIGTFELLQRRYSRPKARALTAPLALATLFGMAIVLPATKNITVDLTVFWHLGLVVVCGTGALLVAKMTPRAPADAGVDDGTWAKQLTIQLRRREDMTEGQIARILAEARVHASDAGTGLHEEFGSPRSYAARFEHNPAPAFRRDGLYPLILALCTGIIAISPLVEGSLPTWWTLLAAVLFVRFVYSVWRNFGAAKRSPRGPAPTV